MIKREGEEKACRKHMHQRPCLPLTVKNHDPATHSGDSFNGRDEAGERRWEGKGSGKNIYTNMARSGDNVSGRRKEGEERGGKRGKM